MRDKDCPYYAQINFTIDIFPVLHDGSLAPNKLTGTEMIDLEISKAASFGVQGFTLEDCINKLREALSKISYED